MISALSAYKEMLSAPVAGKTDSAPVPVSGKLEQSGRTEGSGGTTTDAVSLDLSVSTDVFTAVDRFFNMGRSGRFDAFHKLSPDDKEQFVKIVAELARSGYMGYEELIVDNKVERHETTARIADDRLREAKVYNRPKDPHR